MNDIKVAPYKQDELNLEDIDQIVTKIGRNRESVISILQAIQDKFNYLPEAALNRVCEITDITPAAITGVSSFYSQFRLRPAGQYSIKVCIGTACHVMGAESIFNAFKDTLKIPEHDDTDIDRLFTVEKVACLGCCMLAPAVQIDDITYGFLTPQKVTGVIRDFLETRKNGALNAKHSSTAPKNLAGEIKMCLCSSCIAAGANDVFQEIHHQISSLHLPAILKTVGCTGKAYQTPLIEIDLHNSSRFQYGKVQPENVRSILLKHFRPLTIKSRLNAAATNLLEKLLTNEAREPVTRYLIHEQNDSYSIKQNQIVTAFSGKLDPLNIDEFQNHGGFSSLRYCLKELAPSEIINLVAQSKLRGRGGAGFPTGQKWQAVAASESAEKYIICNGDEGDPGAFMDRMILESFPFRVIEGIIIASYALHARHGYLYIRAEYPLALKRIQEAIEICQSKGLLGENIMGTVHSFQLNVIAGAGAFVCGEETALIEAIHGNRGTPRLRPPYPSTQGLWGKPTLVNNVETFAMIPQVFHHGIDKFTELGTELSKGTKTFALAGKIVRSGLIEVPMGMTLREIVEDIGGGVPDGKHLKAIQVGGPSGGCVPGWLADTPVDYEALTAAGAMMGSGGMVVLDETDCMVDIARYFMTFTQKESCGKCTFCRIGTKRMLEILDRLCKGQGQQGDIEKLEHLAASVQTASLCGLGRTAPNPVISTLTHFRDEYEAHIHGRCPAGKCRDLITFSVTDECIGCTRCAQRCPVNAITMRPYETQYIDIEKCTRCGTCYQACPVKAIKVE